MTLDIIPKPEDKEVPQEQEEFKSWKYKIKYKQNAKGVWQAEFHIGAEIVAELEAVQNKIAIIVKDKLSELNGEKQTVINGSHTESFAQHQGCM